MRTVTKPPAVATQPAASVWPRPGTLTALRFAAAEADTPDKLLGGWVSLLTDAVGRPDLWVTNTFADDVGDWGGVRRWAEFYAEMRRRLGHRAEFVRVREWHRDRPSVHYHSLFYNCRDRNGWPLDRVSLALWAQDNPRLGRTSIERFDPAQGAAAYCVKYCHKGWQFDYDLSRNLGRVKR